MTKQEMKNEVLSSAVNHVSELIDNLVNAVEDDKSPAMAFLEKLLDGAGIEYSECDDCKDGCEDGVVDVVNERDIEIINPDANVDPDDDNYREIMIMFCDAEEEGVIPEVSVIKDVDYSIEKVITVITEALCETISSAINGVVDKATIKTKIHDGLRSGVLDVIEEAIHTIRKGKK